MERRLFFRRGYLIYRKAMRVASEKAQAPDMSRFESVSKNRLAIGHNLEITIKTKFFAGSSNKISKSCHLSFLCLAIFVIFTVYFLLFLANCTGNLLCSCFAKLAIEIC